MSRATAGKIKLMAQRIAEEGEEAAAMADREVGSTYLEVAFVKTKDGRDGKAVEEIFKSLVANGPEAYYKYSVSEEGDGIRPSSHVLVAVGLSENYNEQWRNMDSDLAMRLKSLVKSYNSFIFTTNATEVFKAQVAANNESGKCYQIDLVESPAYAIPDGRKGVANFVAQAGDALVVRIEETTFESEADMQGYEKAMGLLFASPHRQTAEPKYRVSGSIPGTATEITTPIAFTMQKTEKDFFMVVFDEVATISDDGDNAAANEDIMLGLSTIKAANYYFTGPGADSAAVKAEVAEAQKKGFFAKAPKTVF